MIVNDSLFVTNAIGPQAKLAFLSSLESSSASIMPIISAEDSLKMVQSFAKTTNLRLDWAKKCLEETKWNLDGAIAVFQMAKNDGKIPPEAFAFIC